MTVRIASLLGATALSFGLCLPVLAEAPAGDTIVATVNGTDITLADMADVRASLPAQYLQLPDDVLFEGILEQLIQQTAIAQAGEGSLTARDEREIAAQRRSYIATKVLNAEAEAAVTEEAVKALYDAQYVNAEPATEYSAAHILVATEEEAKAIKAELDGGADFAAIAKEKSTDPGSGANGGDLGWFGKGMMVPEFENAVIALSPGQISAPVQSQFGWHVIRLAETRPAPVPPLEDVREELAADLQQKAVEAYVSALVDKADVTRSIDGLDPAVLKDPALAGE
jgi:peptidyl-prolyl cis-trans isomerase C